MYNPQCADLLRVSNYSVHLLQSKTKHIMSVFTGRLFLMVDINLN